MSPQEGSHDYGMHFKREEEDLDQVKLDLGELMSIFLQSMKLNVTKKVLRTPVSFNIYLTLSGKVLPNTKFRMSRQNQGVYVTV